MNNTWVTGDLHLGHKGIVTFTDDKGNKLRPWDTIEEHDEAIISLWNETVTPNDKVYVLGDVVINRKCIPSVGRLNGKKVLVKGNHDLFELKDWLPYFYDIRAYIVMKNVIMSHIPLHPTCVKERWIGNIHAHLHSFKMNDPRYLCVSLEQTEFKPILLEEAIERLKKQQ